MTAVNHRAFQGTTSDTFVYPMILHELAVFNSGQDSLTVTVCTQKRELDTFHLPPGGALDERVQRFCKIKVTAKGPYSGYVRRGKDVFWDTQYLDN
ncbi:hypothetical protein [Paenibacillus amylolyticus]|uniref:Uncharacterized protein n=1 Tax=Paenibacillus amylolyticus TaxID=1451 RepID=A0A117I3N9_PAEAM|nr:hypothetical protein [Paenibacillus amylolyticus]GAS85652.1 unknown protein [Paenibacillus amylolyticus]